ncbi:MAG: ABC transporter permease [Clostridia bacterium]|nr:ABC transporter permease [Clostridia bacterium]
MQKRAENGFGKRVKTMLAADVRRAFTTPLLYIMIGCALVAPILILVMTAMMDGTTSTDVNGNVTTMEGFKNVWQIISSVAGGTATGTETDAAMGGMSLTAMCNINLVYFAVAVFVCLFISEEFRSGYAKNLFAVRAKKTDYVFSKTVIGCIAGAGMIVAFFIGSMIGGGIAGISFGLAELGVNVGEVALCLLTKVLLVSVFIAIFVLMSVIAKQKAWLSILLSLGVGMFLFMMIPMMTPLNGTMMNVLLCLAGGGMFTVGLGVVSVKILQKTALV